MVVDCERAGIKGGHAVVLNGANNSTQSQPETVHKRVAEMSAKPLLINLVDDVPDFCVGELRCP